MTRREQTTVDALALKFDHFLAEDKKWKDEVTLKLTPLVKERDDRIILQKAGQYFWKGIVAIVLFVAAVGSAVHYFPDILRVFSRK